MTTTAEMMRHPALLIGLGGTGVRALRFARWLAENGDDPELKALYRSGGLQFVGIDTDWKSNDSEQTLDDYVLPRAKAWRSGQDAPGRTLPQIDRMVMVKTEDIVRAFDTVRRQSRRRAAEPLQPAETTASALPEPTKPSLAYDWMLNLPRRARDELTLGQARHEGAAQWRPLGRLGLFTRAPEIHAELTEAYTHVRDATGSNAPVRVYIISSLSGGTGAGMFWDVAFLMRIIDPACILSGCFLLPDAFSGLDAGDRVEANAYASLKELAVYKNWRLRPGERFPVSYPIGSTSVTFDAERGADSVFNLVYIYQSFATTGETADAPNIHQSKLRLSQFRMAENILAQLRRDVRATLEGLENKKGDVGSPASHEERGYVFSTSAFTPLGIVGPEPIVHTLLAALVRKLRERTYGDRPRVSRKDLIHWLLGDRQGGDDPLAGLHTLDFLRPLLDDSSRDAKDLVTLWRDAQQGAIPEDPHRIKEMEGNVRRLKEEAERLRATRHRRPDLIRDLYKKHIDERLRGDWEQEIRAETWTSSQKLVSRSLTDVDLYVGDLEAAWKPVRERLKHLRTYLSTELKTLDSDAVTWLENAAKQLKALGADSSAARGEPVSIRAPMSLVQIRAELGILRDGRDDDLRRWQAQYGSGPAERAVIALCDGLLLTLDDVRRNHPAQRWPAIIGAYLARHANGLVADINDVLRVNESTGNLLLQRTRSLGQYGRTRVGEIYEAFEPAAERFESLMGPLPSILDKVMTSEEGNALARAVNGIMDGLMEAGRRYSVEIQQEVEKNDVSRETWVSLLRSVCQQLRDRGSTMRPGQKAMVDIIAIELESKWLASKGYLPALQTEEALRKYLDRAHLYASVFAHYWCEQPEFVAARLGGEKELEATIARCRSKVFGRGAVEQSVQLSRLVIGMPRMNDVLFTETAASIEKKLREVFSLAARKALNLAPAFTQSPSQLPFVYYEELYRAGAEILEIGRYHQQYTKVEEHMRPLLHVVAAGADLGELPVEGEPNGVVHCGNEDCRANIAALDRGSILCPHCSRPIRNRCGNTGCPADDLSLRIGAVTLDGRGRPSRRHCPECSGELRTYWWRCPDGAHGQRWLSTRQGECPQCLQEFRVGSRPYMAIHRVDAATSSDCPGCLSLQLPPEKRIRIPSRLRAFFELGVRPHDQTAFERLVDRHMLEEHFCPNGDKAEHYLFPTLEVQEDGRMRRYLAYRDGSVFIGNESFPAARHACFHCGHPVRDELIDDLRAGRRIACPRCLRPLKECPYCTHHDHLLFSPMECDGVTRCPRCTNRFARDHETFSRQAAEGLKHGGFCRNLFGCRAGALPWSTAADYHLKQCRACSPDQTKEAAALLPFQELERHIERCPMCMMLLGLPNGGRVERLSPPGLAVHFVDREPRSLQEPCVVCGTTPAAVLQWMEATDYFSGTTIDDVPKDVVDRIRHMFTGAYAIPDLPAKDGMDVLQAMMEIADPTDLYRTIMALPSLAERSVTIPSLARELDRLFIGRSITPRVARKKLEDLGVMHQEIRSREQEEVVDLPF